jgi:hypothetical protein
LRVARGTPYLNLAWLTFAVGASYSYLLAEAGADMGFGGRATHPSARAG